MLLRLIQPPPVPASAHSSYKCLETQGIQQTALLIPLGDDSNNSNLSCSNDTEPMTDGDVYSYYRTVLTQSVDDNRLLQTIKKHLNQLILVPFRPFG